jgi:hypothetical protein
MARMDGKSQHATRNCDEPVYPIPVEFDKLIYSRIRKNTHARGLRQSNKNYGSYATNCRKVEI